MGIVQVGVTLGGNCQGGSYPEWGFCLVGVFQVGFVRGNHLGGNFCGKDFLVSTDERRLAFTYRISDTEHSAPFVECGGICCSSVFRKKLLEFALFC